MDAYPEADGPIPIYGGWSNWPSDRDIITDIGRWCETLRELETAATALEAKNRVRALEELISAAAAAQAREAAAFQTHRKREDAANYVPKREQGVYASSELALAKRVSPAMGRKFLSASKALVNDLPHTLEALADGGISETKAHIVAEETAGLTAEERRVVDEDLKESVSRSGNRRLRREARALAAQISAEKANERAETAAEDRRVTMSVLDNGMGRVTAILPLPQAISAYECLREAAAKRKADHQAFGRNRGQLMSDIFVERLTGQSSAGAVPTEVHVVMEAQSLFSDGRVPAWLPGYGPLPAETTRNFLAANQAKSFIRRMFTAPDSRQLVGMDSRRRTFSGLLRRMVIFRDDVCRTPWCDAPIKHADHATPVAEGGATEWSNASGLCAACNYTKEHAGWKHEATAEELKVTTPTGDEYEASTPPFVTKLGSVPTKQGHSPPGETHNPVVATSANFVVGPDAEVNANGVPGEMRRKGLSRVEPSPVEELFSELILEDTG